MSYDDDSSGQKKAGEKGKYDNNRKLEIAKCMSDPMYFIKNYVYVNEPSHGDMLMDLFPYQEKIINGFANHKNIILMCGRQQGKCVVHDTLITINGQKQPIGDMIKLSFKDKIVNKLESILLKLV